MDELIVSSDDAQPSGQVAPAAPAPEPAPVAPIRTSAMLLGDELAQAQAANADIDPVFHGAEDIAAYKFGPVPEEMPLREMLVAEGIPAHLGTQLGTLLAKATANPPSDFQMKVDKSKCIFTLVSKWGNDSEKNFAIAEKQYQRMAERFPRFQAMLENTGVGNDPWFIESLFTLAQGKRGR